MKQLRSTVLALLMAFATFVPAVHADDIEIYTSTTANSIKPPYTVIVLDLNLLGICNSVVTQTSNPNNPDSPQLCLNVTSSIILSDLLGGVTSNPTTYLTNLLLGTGTTDAGRAGALCDLYGVLGLTSPVVQLPAVGLLLAPLLQGVSTLSCGTLSFLLGIPLLSGVVNPLLGGFVGQLVAGLLNPLLSTAVGQLPSTVNGLLQSTFSGVLNLGQVGLVSVLESILTNLINSNVAVMVSHADRSNATGAAASACSYVTARRSTANCSNGAYMLVGFTPLVNQGAVTTLLNKVSSLLTNTLSPTNLLNATTALLSTALTTPTQLLPPFQAKEVYAELAHYLAGNDIYNAPLARWDGLTSLLTRDTTIELANGNYSKPTLECRTANVLNIMLTNNIRDADSDATLRSYFTGLPASGAITLANVVSQARSPGFKDNAGNDINLRSFFLVQNLLTSTATLANSGATVLTYTDSLGLLGLGPTAASLLKPSLSVDASLLTPSLTISQAAPGSLRPEAFFSVFKPDPNLKPRWPGNLKRLEARADSSGNYQYYDANNALAIASDGRIKTTALTYWTNTGLLGSGVTADGRSSTLGGAGQNIPGYLFTGGGNPGRANGTGRRALYYDRITTGGYALNALDANTSTTSAVTDLITDTAAVAETSANCTVAKTTAQVTQEILLYARGYDTGTSCKGSKGSATTVVGRDWMHGALLHSRPVAINYGARSGFSVASPDIRVVYGAADGFFRMVSSANGSESWGFMPRVVMSQQKVLRENTTVAGLPYGVDGAPAVLLQDRSSTGGAADGKIESTNANDKAYVYFGLRRGGSYYYAMNVTNPDAPSLMWRIGPDGLYTATGLVAGTAAQFAELALTFSTPQIGRMQVKEGSTTVTKSVLIFGGGYYGGRDSSGNRLYKDFNRGSDGRVGTDDAKGNAIYIVDAETGALVWKAIQGAYSSGAPYSSSSLSFAHPLMVNSIPSDITAVDTGGDGLIDRLYVADTGGRLWRGDFADADRAKWTLTPLASIGRQSSSSGAVADDRRFFHAPDYVPFRDASGAFDVIVMTSGDREDPLNITTENYLYAYRDNAINSGKLATDVKTTESQLAHQADFADLTTVCAGSAAADCAVSTTLTPLITATGWRLKLTGRGEKGFSQPLTTGGTIFFTSYVPQDPGVAVCEPQEGISKLYGVSLTDSRSKIGSFATDSDNDPRSTISSTPGLPGEFSTLNTNTVIANTQALSAKSKRYYPVYWRERRGDDETPP